MLAVAITRIDAETDDHDFKKAYNEAKAMPDGEERQQHSIVLLRCMPSTFSIKFFE